MINIRMNNVDTTQNKKLSPKITVVGVGGAGGNAVNNMIASNLTGVDFVVCNTDAQALVSNLADHKVQLGVTLTEGLGAGAKPEIGRAAAEESLDDVMQHLEHANMAFITAGMGGGTGTYGASVIAKNCREKGILTVGVVTKPFHFEGTNRMRMAEDGIAEMQSYVDTLIVIPNQNLFRIVNEKTTFADAFKMADSVLLSAVRSVTDLIVMPGLINLDFADIRSVMQEMGKAVIGSGESTGDRRATEAAEKAISNPLLDDISMKGARGVIINVTGGYDMTLFEVDEACNRIRDEIDPNANIIFGSTFDEGLEGKMRVSVVATGIDAAVAEKKVRTSSSSTAGERFRPSARLAEEAPVSARPTPVATTPVQTYVPSYQAAQQQRSAVTPVPAQTYTEPVSVRVEEVNAIPSYSAPTQEQPVPAYQQAQQMHQPAQIQQPVAAEMRGARMGGAFIPPQPIEPVGGNQQSHVTQSAAPVAHQASVQFSTPNPERKRGASLFERITGGIRRLHEEASHDEFASTESPPAPSQGNYYPQQEARRSQAQHPQTQPASQSAPAQGRLNIDAPARSAEEENPLDIPAFLRRQSS